MVLFLLVGMYVFMHSFEVFLVKIYCLSSYLHFLFPGTEKGLWKQIEHECSGKYQ